MAIIDPIPRRVSGPSTISKLECDAGQKELMNQNRLLEQVKCGKRISVYYIRSAQVYTECLTYCWMLDVLCRFIVNRNFIFNMVVETHYFFWCLTNSDFSLIVVIINHVILCGFITNINFMLFVVIINYIIFMWIYSSKFFFSLGHLDHVILYDDLFILILFLSSNYKPHYFM